MQIGSDLLPVVDESLFDNILFKPEDKISDSCRSPVMEQNLLMQRSVQPQDETGLQRDANRNGKFGNQLR